MRPPRRSVTGTVLLALWAAILPPTRAQEAPPVPGPTETVRVQLAQFDVVVRDREGKLVPGLGRDDFEVLEDGQPVEIAAVDAWGEPEAPPGPASPPPGDTSTAPLPPAHAEAPGPRETRSFVLLFDALTTTSALRLHQAKRAAVEFVRTDLAGDDLVSVYKLDAALRPQAGFTRDRERTIAAIQSIGWMPNSSFQDELADSVLAYRSQAGADYMPQRLARGALLNQQTLDWTREHLYRSLQGVSGVFEGLPGRHVLVLLSAGMPMTAFGDIERDAGGFTRTFRELIKALARQGVTVYSIDIGDDLAIGDVSKSIDWRVAAGKIGIEESTLSDLGLDPATGAGSASARRQVLGVLAAETGGRLLTHSDLDRAFDLVDEESSRFYRISVKIAEGRDASRYHRVVVRVKRPGSQVSARRGRFGDVLPGSSGSVQASGRQVVDSLARYRTLPLRGTTAILPGADGGPARVTVVVEAVGPVELARGQNGEASVELDFMVVARAGGEVVARYDRPLHAVVQAQGVAALEQAFRLEAALQLPPGPYQLQANVRLERPPQFGSWSEDVLVRAPADGPDLRFDEVVLAPAADVSPLLVQAPIREGEADPFALGPQARLLPATSASYPAAGALSAMFWLRGLTTPEGAAPKLQLAVEVVDGEGVTRTLPARLALFQPSGPGRHRGVVEVDLTGLPAGGYALTLRAEDGRRPGATAESRRAFEVR